MRNSVNDIDYEDPIAIVGMACRFPGLADSIEAYWCLLQEAGITVGEVPALRWDWRKHYSTNTETPGRAYVKQGNFIRQDVRAFDAGFFGISPREAEVMDPQQRLLLEVAWEAIEHAGSDLDRLCAVRTGVYIGAFTLDNLIGRMGGTSRFETGPHTAVGSTATILSNRISHAFNFSGPSLSVDTACSSSMVALHLASQAIWNGECEVALAGGVNVMTRPEYVIAMSKGHFLAPDGRSKTFDASGNGYGRGEGAGIVMLKPLSRAQADGDRILALIRATGCNQDGRTEGITVPSGDAQRKLMRQVLAKAGLQAKDVHYVEAHGTGTALGDPIETAAIGSVFGVGRDAALPVGSVKANIGHLEAASGIASVIKLVLSLRHRQLPAVAGLTKLNPAIDFEGLNIRAPRSLENLPAGNLRMAVNSFGYGGTNAHVILESAPDTPPQPAAAELGDWALLPVSARSDQALAELIEEWDARLADPAQDLQPLLAGAALRRTHHDCRVAFAGRKRDEIRNSLQKWLETRPRADRPLKDTRPVFVFTGMGPQWWGMARELLTQDADSQQFAAEFDGHFQALSGWSLVEALLQPEATSRVTDTQVAQPANFLCQALVTRWLGKRGIKPAAVVGHSVGEVSVAWASGVLSLPDAIRVSYMRSQLQARTAGQGGMLAVGLSEEDALAWIDSFAGRIEIAAINGPSAVTLAGDEASLDELAGRLEVRSIFNRRLRVEVAYHSRFMDPLLPELTSNLASLQPGQPHLPVWSTVTSQEESEAIFDAAYWCRNVREPVRFRAAIENLLGSGYRLFLEIGPHPVLGGNLREIMSRQGDDGRNIATLVRGGSDVENLHLALCRLYAAGVALDWVQFNGTPDPEQALPRHPWQREILWTEAKTCARERLGPEPGYLCGEAADHPTPTWERPLNIYYAPWVADHQVDGLVLLPGAAYVDTALALAQQMLPGEGALCAEKISLRRPLVLDGDTTLLYSSTFHAATGLVEIASRDEAGGPWTHHAEATIRRISFNESLVVPEVDSPQELDIAALYLRFAQMGLVYGPACRRIERLVLGRDRVQAHLAELKDAPQDLHHLLHPTVLDGAFQALLALVITQGDIPWVPISIEAVTLREATTGPLICVGRLSHRTEREIVGELWLKNTEGRLVAHVEGVRCVPAKHLGDPLQGLLHREAFTELLPPSEAKRLGAWLLLSEDGYEAGGLGAGVMRELQRANVARLLPFSVGAVAQVTALGRVDDAAGLRSIFKEYLPHTLAGVAYLAHGQDNNPETARARVARVHALAQALADELNPPRVYLVTQGAQAALGGDQLPGYAQAAIQGYGRVLHNECPNLQLSTVDVDANPATLTALVAELLADDAEDDLALRGSSRLGRRVQPWTSELMGAAATEARVSEPMAVQWELRGGKAFWRESALPEPKAGEVLLTILELAQETPGDKPLCSFVAQITQGNAELPSGKYLLGAARVRPASHIALAPQSLVYSLVDTPPENAARLAGLWSGLHEALSRILAQAPSAPLLVFGAQSEMGRIVVSLANLLGVACLIDADALHPQARGLAQRIGRPVGAVVFADQTGLCPQVLPLAATAQIVCLDNALNLDVSPWLGNACAVGVHRVAPLAMFDAAPQPMAASLDALVAAVSQARLSLPRSTRLMADEWVEQGSAIGQAVVLAPLPMAVAADAGRFSARGAWLITGGFGGFGLVCAEWLAAQGADELILVGRSGANAEAAAKLAVLEQAGTRIRSVRADIADKQAVSALFRELAAEKLNLTGVLHAAGVLADMRLQDMTEADLQRVMVPKIDGAWNLAHALDSHGLSVGHFLLFSSIAATVGNSRQANYAAANVALDALAAQRRAQGKPADCVAWGALAFGMGVSNESLTRHFSGMGLRPLNETEALAGLAAILEHRPGSLVFAAVDWEQWGRFEPSGARSPRFAHLTGKDANNGESALKAEFAAMERADREEVVTHMLAEALSGPLKMAADRIDADRSLSDLGVDSLMAVEVQMAINAVFAVEFSTLELMRGNTVSMLASRVLERMGITETATD